MGRCFLTFPALVGGCLSTSACGWFDVEVQSNNDTDAAPAAHPDQPDGSPDAAPNASIDAPSDSRVDATADTNPPDGPSCGNGIREDMESCDDGNVVDVDGCTASCAFTPGLRAHWRFDDLTGHQAVEETGREPGILEFPSGDTGFVSSGKVKGAVRLAQSPNPSYIVLPNFGINPAAGTVSVWVKTTDATLDQHILWGGSSGDGFGGPSNNEFHLTGGRYNRGFITGHMGEPPRTFCNIRELNPVVALQWYHFVMTYRDLETHPTASLHLNGVEIVGELATADSVYEIPDPHDFSQWLPHMYVGRPEGTLWRWLVGYVDELMILDRELTHEEITELYQAQR